MKITPRGMWEGLKSIIGVLIFAIGVTIPVCFWLANLNTTLNEIRRIQRQQYYHTCLQDRTQRDFDKGVRGSLTWLQRQVNSGVGAQPEIPDVPDGGEYCPGIPEQEQEQDRNQGHDHSDIPATIMLHSEIR